MAGDGIRETDAFLEISSNYCSPPELGQFINLIVFIMKTVLLKFFCFILDVILSVYRKVIRTL